MALKQVLALLPLLSPEELQEVRARAGFLGKMSSPKHAAKMQEEYAGDDVTLVLDVLCDVARSVGVDVVAPHVLRKSQQLRDARQKIAPVLEFIRAHARGPVRERALLRTGIRLLYDDLVEMGFPVSARTLLSHLHRLPAIFDRHFPGYARSGILGIVIRERK